MAPRHHITESLNGARVLAILISPRDPRQQHAFASTAHWNAPDLSLEPILEGPSVTVPAAPDGLPPVFRLDSTVRQVLLANHAAVLTPLIEGAEFVAVFPYDVVPSFARPVPGLLGHAIVPGWHR